MYRSATTLLGLNSSTGPSAFRLQSSTVWCNYTPKKHSLKVFPCSSECKKVQSRAHCGEEDFPPMQSCTACECRVISHFVVQSSYYDILEGNCTLIVFFYDDEYFFFFVEVFYSIHWNLLTCTCCVAPGKLSFMKVKKVNCELTWCNFVFAMC